ncbi:MAG TPA: hypothetical protein VIG55_14310 [Methylosinus sp.]|jgi:hypothetical protein
MKAQDFLAWIGAVNARYAANVIELLDVSRNTAQEWVASAKEGRDVPVKRIALAMSAVARGLKPRDQYDR